MALLKIRDNTIDLSKVYMIDLRPISPDDHNFTLVFHPLGKTVEQCFYFTFPEHILASLTEQKDINEWIEIAKAPLTHPSYKKEFWGKINYLQAAIRERKEKYANEIYEKALFVLSIKNDEQLYHTLI